MESMCCQSNAHTYLYTYVCMCVCVYVLRPTIPLLRSESWSGCMQPFLLLTASFWSNLVEFRTFVFKNLVKRTQNVGEDPIWGACVVSQMHIRIYIRMYVCMCVCMFNLTHKILYSQTNQYIFTYTYNTCICTHQSSIHT